jgi:hypothetical protein
VSAAERLFGSWENTLYVAGIDPNLHFPHHTAKETEKDFAAGGTPESSITGVENTQAGQENGKMGSENFFLDDTLIRG